MYLIIGCICMAVCISVLLFGHRRKKICRKICAMTCKEKYCQLQSLIEPFGYCYEPSQDIFSSTVNAPQRSFGYTGLFDRYAPHFGMVFDCVPVYFDYDERTWLVEFWKGQYGINLGCEVGIYKADSLVASIRRKTALFHSVEDAEMLPMCLCLYENGKKLSNLCRKHWWLTVFHMGRVGKPRDLSVQVQLYFPNGEMRSAFVNALKEHEEIEYRVRGLQVQIWFSRCTSCTLPFFRRLHCRMIQWKNRIECKLFLWVTKPLCSSLDRALCLYYLLPRSLQHLLCIKKRARCCQRNCCRRRTP